jgi:Peptidase A4 family/Immunoglobulin domain/Immunoglobulin I-set domain
VRKNYTYVVARGGYHNRSKPERISVDMSATETAHQATKRTRARRRRRSRAAAALVVAGFALGGLIATSSGASPPAVRASLTGASRSGGPMIPARIRANRVARAKIGLFTATPAQLPAAGGKVRLIAVVQGATSCRFSLEHLARPPATRPCGSGNASVTVTVPRNEGASARRFPFALTATGPHSSTSAGPAWVIERAATSSGGAPKITIQPVARSASPGTTVSFNAAATGASSVHWQLSSNDGQTWTNVAAAASASYTLTATIADDGLQYRAVFVNSYGSTDTNPATLLVSSPPPAPTVAATQIAPAVTLQPASVNAVSGAAVTFTAAASGSPAPGAQWQVSTDGGSTWTNVAGANAASYALTAQAGESGYLYRAAFTNAAGTSVSNSATLTVSPPPQAPSLTTQPESQSVLVGSPVTFTAAATGSPAPSVQWLVSTDGGNTWVNVAGADSTSYTIQITTTPESGWEYEAVFTNAAATATSSAAMLTVAQTISPPSVNLQPRQATAAAGSSVTFTAAAAGTPTPAVQWQYSSNSGSTWQAVSGPSSTTPTLTFVATSSENGYQYEAVFSNGSGTATSDPALLTVQTPPQITAQPSSTSVSNGTAAFFAAFASGTPTPTVQWMVSIDGGHSWSDVVGETSATYSFTANQSENGYEYEAVFTNAGGSTSSHAATLTVGGDTSSTNWSGYVATGADDSFTTVTGSWIVPTATCSAATTYSSMWIGIDGYGGSTVEQDGTDSDCLNGAPQYHAWIELYGDDADDHVNDGSSVTLPNAVLPGDSMSATVGFAAGGWTLTIADVTPADHWSSSTTVTWDPSSSASPLQASAEWVVERPELCTQNTDCNLSSLANFGTAAFSSASATENGTPQSLSTLSAFPLQMDSGDASSTLLALPGPLSAGGFSGFSDTFYASN